MLLFSYTWSKALEALSRLNQTDTAYERRVSDYDAPHRFVASGILEAPFGKGRRWGADWHPAVNAFLGGWRLGVIYQFQSGRPLGLGNVAFFGDLGALRTDIRGATVDRTFDTSGFFPPGGVGDIRLDSNIRTLPTRLPWFRGQGINNWDISLTKKFSLGERVEAQLRGEFINAFNTPIFNNPNLDPTSSNFAQVTSQNNLSRQVQIGLRLQF